MELIKDQRILGEKENLAPGLDPVSFTVTLDGGKYQLYCPGAATEFLDFTVTGQAAAAPTGSTQTVLDQSTKEYAAYVISQINLLNDGVKQLDAAVQSGNVNDAKAAYAKARPYYERSESSVEGFVLPGFAVDDNAGNLDYLIDMRESTPVDAKVGWKGFHAIERDLWGGGITAQTKSYSTELVGNAGKLVDVVKTLQYKPEDLANGAADLLEEVQNTKITGEEEEFSHIDFVDFAGNVEGAQQAFASLRPGLQKIDPTLVAQIDQQFKSVQATLDGYRDPTGTGRVQAVDTAVAGNRRTQADGRDRAAARQPLDDRPEGGDGRMTAESSGVSRRGVLGRALWAGVGGLAVGAAGGGAAGWAQASSVHRDNTDKDAVDLHRSYPFYGQAHPAGVATEPQRNCVFMSFTLAPGATRQDLQTLLARWSAASAVLQQGNPVGTVQPTSAVAPAIDTGEAFGLSPASLTVTIGLGPSVFGERFGLAAHKPALLAELPTLNGDNLDPGLTGGDLSIQACADDPQVCYHATRNLARIGRRIVTPSWAVLGFGRASAGRGSKLREIFWGSRTERATSAPRSSTPSSCGSPTATNRG